VQGERAILARDVLQAIGSALVSDTSSFGVETELSGESVTVFALRCAAQDRGQLIGRGGKMFRALLDIVAAIGLPKGEQLSISEVRKPERPQLSKPTGEIPFNPKWPRESVEWLAQIVSSAAFSAEAEIQIREMPRGGCVTVLLPVTHRPELHTELMSAIRTVFAAIGTNHGCSLIIDFSFK
jgi:predicted RNA-binding protein YlqC (UPF0109 family)